MIINDTIKKEWHIFDAVQFKKEFEIETEIEDGTCDEDYIIEHLTKDKRKFRVMFMESLRDNAYEEYWKICEVE